MNRKKFILGGTLSLLIIIAAIFGTVKLIKPKHTEPVYSTDVSNVPSNNLAESTTEEPTTANTFTIDLSFIGDCLCATDENTYYANCFNDVADAKNAAILSADGILSDEAGKIIPCYVYTGDTNNWQPDIITNKAQKKKVIKFMKGKTDLPY